MRLRSLCLLALLPAAARADDAPPLKKGEKIVFLGNSITASARSRTPAAAWCCVRRR